VTVAPTSTSKVVGGAEDSLERVTVAAHDQQGCADGGRPGRRQLAIHAAADALGVGHLQVLDVLVGPAAQRQELVGRRLRHDRRGEPVPSGGELQEHLAGMAAAHRRGAVVVDVGSAGEVFDDRTLVLELQRAPVEDLAP
jgi:hypothetical protein